MCTVVWSARNNASLENIEDLRRIRYFKDVLWFPFFRIRNASISEDSSLFIVDSRCNLFSILYDSASRVEIDEL